MLAKVFVPLGVVTLFVVAVTLQQAQIRTLTSELQLANIQLQSCGNRLSNLVEDIVSDREIDLLDEDGLRNVPAEWLLPPGPTD